MIRLVRNVELLEHFRSAGVNRKDNGHLCGKRCQRLHDSREILMCIHVTGPMESDVCKAFSFQCKVEHY